MNMSKGALDAYTKSQGYKKTKMKKRNKYADALKSNKAMGFGKKTNY